MSKNDVLTLLMTLSRQAFPVFISQMETGKDNRFETLKLLSQEEQVTAGRIAEYLDIKSSSVTQIIKKLDSLGMVEKKIKGRWSNCSHQTDRSWTDFLRPMPVMSLNSLKQKETSRRCEIILSINEIIGIICPLLLYKRGNSCLKI